MKEAQLLTKEARLLTAMKEVRSIAVCCTRQFKIWIQCKQQNTQIVFLFHFYGVITYYRRAIEIINSSVACRLVKNSDGELPLHLASKDDKNKQIVEALFRDCSDEAKKQQLTAKNKIFGNTPLHVATFLGNTAIAESIIQECDDTPLLTELLKERNTMQDTPVHVAAGKNHTTRFITFY